MTQAGAGARSAGCGIDQEGEPMTEAMYHAPTKAIAKKEETWPDAEQVFQAFSQRVFADGALAAKTN